MPHPGAFQRFQAGVGDELLDRPLRLPEQSLLEVRLGEQPAQRALVVGVGAGQGGERVPGGAFGGVRAAGEQQRPYGTQVQPAQPRIVRRRRLEGHLEQLHGYQGRPPGERLGGGEQPVEYPFVDLADGEQVLAHPVGLGTAGGERPGRPQAQCGAYRRSDVLGQRPPDQVVPEQQLVAGVGEQPGLDRLAEHADQRGRGLAEDRRQFGDLEGRAEDRRDFERVARG